MHLRTAVQALPDAGVECVIVGGVSATLHGSARLTYDLDICYSPAPEKLRRLSSALAPFHPRPRGFPAGLPFGWDERTPHYGTVFTLQTDIGAMDAYASVQEHSIALNAFDRQITTLDLPGLIQGEMSPSREKDISALAELESLLEAGEF